MAMIYTYGILQILILIISVSLLIFIGRDAAKRGIVEASRTVIKENTLDRMFILFLAFLVFQSLSTVHQSHNLLDQQNRLLKEIAIGILK